MFKTLEKVISLNETFDNSLELIYRLPYNSSLFLIFPMQQMFSHQ